MGHLSYLLGHTSQPAIFYGRKYELALVSLRLPCYHAEAEQPRRQGEEMAKIRWRLIMGLASLGATLALTVPANSAALQAAAGNAVAGRGVVADLIWPNCAELMDIIWPNAGVIGGLTGGTTDLGGQNSQGNQDDQGDNQQ
jgi:hypothetical protein